MKLKITKDFAFAHRGCEIVRYFAGTEVETDDKELIAVALSEKRATKARQARQTKDNGSAPENKLAGGDDTEPDDEGDDIEQDGDGNGLNPDGTDPGNPGDEPPQA